jgi:hypothetical protein
MDPRDKVVFQDTAWTFHRQVSDEISWKTAAWCSSIDIQFVDSHFPTESHFTSTEMIPVDLQVTRSVWAGQMARAIPGVFPTECGFMLAAAAIQLLISRSNRHLKLLLLLCHQALQCVIPYPPQATFNQRSGRNFEGDGA